MASSISSGERRAIIARALAVRAFIVWTLAAAALASAGPARAEAPPANEAARSAARAKLVEGVDALGRGEHRLALDKFEQAYALVPSPKIHYDFGLAYLGLGRRAEALSAFERFLAEAQDAPADKREKAAQRAAALRPQVGAATVTVEGARDGVTIAIDGREVGRAPLARPVYLDPGRHELAARLPGGGAGPVQSIDAHAGATIDVILRIASDPLSPRSGERVRERGPTSEERAPTDTRRIAALSIGAAGVALLGAGLTFGVLAKRESDSLSRDSANGAPPNKATLFDPDKESRGTTYQTLQVVSLVTGAVGLATGIVLYATTRGRALVAPVASRGLTGATVQVHF
jgi:hypothetical protein